MGTSSKYVASANFSIFIPKCDIHLEKRKAVKGDKENRDEEKMGLNTLRRRRTIEALEWTQTTPNAMSRFAMYYQRNGGLFAYKIRLWLFHR